MTDRELLERAARAAGYSVRWHVAWECHVFNGEWSPDGRPMLHRQDMIWRPLHDDGEAMRLAVKLHFGLSIEAGTVLVHSPAGVTVARAKDHGDDECAATRFAIVRAAAAMAPP